jgi:hypothetical protein
MNDPFEVGKTTPLPEIPAKAADLNLNFTPVDIPAYKPGNLTGLLLANFDFAGGVMVKTLSFHCQACGNQSDKQDLFCITCGEFLELQEGEVMVEKSVALDLPVCDDCGADISSDEIFCMSCGSVVAL